MRLIIYKCDQCNNILSDDKINEKHLSLSFNHNSGWAKGQENSNRGIFTSTISGIHQFCDTKCLSKYLNNDKK